MRINNLMGMTAYRNTVLNTNALSDSIAKLSSGLRINSAKDDAAGLAISQKMKGQIRGLDQANRNINDGINLAMTAGGGATEIEEIVQRMRELTVQAANDTNTDQDRKAIAMEIEALTKEIDSTAENLEFNTIKIINCADPEVLTSNSSSLVSDNIISLPDTTSTTTTYVKLPKGSTVDTTPMTSTATTTSTTTSTVSYEESETVAGKYDIWKDCYTSQSKEVIAETTLNKTTDTTTAYSGIVVGSAVSNPATVVALDGVPRFTANSAAGTTINMYCALTRAEIRVGGVVSSLYDQPSTRVINGDGSVTNTFAPIGGIQIIQKISLIPGADGDGTYVADFDFKNVGIVDPTAFSFKFSMDAMNTHDTSETATIIDSATPGNTSDDIGILDTADARVTISSTNSDTIYYGDIGNLISTFDLTPGSLGSFDGHTGAALYWDKSLAINASDNGKMNYAVELKSDYYEYTTTVHDYDKTQHTVTTENIENKVIVPEQLAIQAGANAYQIYPLRLYNLKCEKIGLIYSDDFGVKHTGLQVDTNAHCQTSLTTLDKVIDTISSVRSYFGAAQNRMNHMINVNGVSEENLSSSESIIADVDMAKEMMSLTKANILGQAATSMLAQSNKLNSNMVLGLLQ